LVGAIVLSTIIPAAARAQDRSACLAAYDSGQAARDDGRLVKAREAFAVCASDACSHALRGDCITWLREVDAVLPSIVLRAVDEVGRDETRIDVDLDGERLAHPLDGKAIRIDPGPHTLRFFGRPYEAIEQKVVVARAEQDRVIVVHLKHADAPPRSAATRGESPSTRPPLALPIALGAGALLAFGGATYFYARGIHDGDALRAECGSPPSCSRDSVDAVHTKLVVGDVLAGVGLVAAAVAAFVLTRP
jgi:hypothetical protein